MLLRQKCSNLAQAVCASALRAVVAVLEDSSRESEDPKYVIGVIQGLYWDNGEEIGNYYLGFRL